MEPLSFIELTDNVNCPNFSFKYSNNLTWKYCYKDDTIYNQITECKNKIDTLQPSCSWDRGKKINNKYELIHLPNKRVRADSISLYEPLSRSYFKMWEILHEFPIDCLLQDEPIQIMGIAEGPGGFIEALHNYRRKYKANVYDSIVGITLLSDNNDIPGWKKAKKFLSKNKNISIDYGIDKTGNIYHIDNIKYLHKKYNNLVHIVTADGGFDFSDDFNHQEQKSYHIIFCEIVLAMSCLRKGGVFICKIFDIFSKTTVSLLQFCKAHFKSVLITKPHTSRPCNSEKYIICKDFIGISKKYLRSLHELIDDWNTIDINNWNIITIFKDTIPKEFVKEILEYNTKNSLMQIYNIEKKLDYIKQNKKLDDTKDYQTKMAVNWCNKYKIKINNNSSFI